MEDSYNIYQIPRMVPTVVARFSFGGVAIRYVLPVLCMPSYLHTMARNIGDAMKAYTQIGSTDGSTN